MSKEHLKQELAAIAMKLAIGAQLTEREAALWKLYGGEA